MSADRPSSTAHADLLRQSLAAINSLEADVARLRGELDSRRAADAEEPIALIGAGCRLPGGVHGLDSYWRLLDAGTNAVSVVPPERLALGGWDPGSGSSGGWHAGLLENIDGFDPRFFGISAREAVTMDPQQRLVLEVGWEALENAGYAPGGLAGSSTGVFIGISTSDYSQLVRESGAPSDVYVATGNAHNVVAGRLSFLLGLQGPSMAVDTACSSSLVAIHLACLSLRARNCSMALAGGVNVLLSEQPFQCFSAWGMMAPDGKCKAFDASANGFVRAEGCGVVVLKRLSDALADGDNILAIVRGSAVNQDGRSSGLTVPNGPAQEAVIRQALAAARVAPAEVGYVEAHGTGTSLGDPIEAQALGAVLGESRRPEHPLVVGSVKTNLGHLESAAGVAGILKVVLSIQRGSIPAHLHFHDTNPQIDWAGTSVVIPVEARDWRRGPRRRIAGISSFGFSGTNAHVILEEPPVGQKTANKIERPLHLLALSARVEPALDGRVESMQGYLGMGTAALPDLAYTMNSGRSHFRERLAIVASDTNDLRQKLAEGKCIRGVERPTRGKLAFLFTGQGSQWPGMCRQLYDSQPVFREALDECASRLRLERPLLDVIYGSDSNLLDQTAYTQPALFSIEWALAKLWKSWGVEPDVVLGHSIGEYAALCVAGVWTLEEGLRLITERGRLMQRLGPGWGMIAVLSGPDKTEEALRGLERFASVAARNAPASTVVSGRLQELTEIERRLTTSGIRSMRLPVSHGFHSSQMEEVAGEFARHVKAVELREPRCRIVSSVTGKFADLHELRDDEYWRRQIRDSVQFQTGMETLRAADFDLFLEVGPAPTLCGLGKQCIGADGLLWAPSIRRERGAWDQMLESLAQLYVRGAEVNWRGYDAPYSRSRVALPTYPFQRQRYWIERMAEPEPKRKETAGHPLLGERVAVAGTPETYIWETEISTARLPYLVDHRVQGSAVVPGTLYIEMAAAAASEIYGDSPVAITDIQFLKPLFVSDHAARVQLSLAPVDGTVRIHSWNGGSRAWVLHARGRVVPVASATGEVPRNFEAQAAREMTREEFYAFFRQRGNLWGPAFQGVHHAWLSDCQGWSEIQVPESIRYDISRYHFHPAIADACGHVLAAIAPPDASGIGGAFVGQGIDRVCLYHRPRGGRMLTHARLTPTSDPALFRGDVQVFDEDGTLISHLEGAQLRYLDFETAKTSEWLYRLAWRETPRAEPAIVAGHWLVLGGKNARMTAALVETMAGDGVMCEVLSEQSPSLLKEALNSRNICAVVNLRGLDAHEPDPDATLLSDEAGAMLEVIRVMAGAGAAQLWTVTSGLAEIESGPSQESVWQAPLRGLARSLSVEHPELWGGLIDLDPVSSDQDNAESLWHYLRAPAGEDQVCVRAGRRFALRLEPYRLGESGGIALRIDGAYLITGGLGGLGLEVARWLVQRGARHLILMGRTGVPDRSRWRDLPAKHPQSNQVKAIRELELTGASIHVASFDVSDGQALTSFLDGYAMEGRPPIRGVIHSAGIVEHEMLVDLTAAQLDRLLRPKMAAWLLDRAFMLEPLDFFVLFSSAAALLNSPRLGAYAAANSFLDAVALRRRSRGLPALSINWGMWGEAGMASRFDGDGVRALAEHGMGSMTTKQGLEALERLMVQPLGQSAVLPIDWQKWGKLYPRYTSSPLLANLFQGGSEASEKCSASGFQPRISGSPEQLIQYLVETLASVLGFSPSEVDSRQAINNLGIDSLTALEFRNRIESDLGVRIPTVRFLQGPTLAELSTEIRPQLNQRSEPNAGSESKGGLLARLDDLTDSEVDAALADLLASELL
jgi:acyl transferase domain-containing protein/acyl carrier protein